MLVENLDAKVTLRRICTTFILGTALQNFGTRANSFVACERRRISGCRLSSHFTGNVARTRKCLLKEYGLEGGGEENGGGFDLLAPLVASLLSFLPFLPKIGGRGEERVAPSPRSTTP